MPGMPQIFCVGGMHEQLVVEDAGSVRALPHVAKG